MEMQVIGRVFGFLILSAAALSAPAFAQTKTDQEKPAINSGEAPAANSIIPNEYRMNLMIRTTIVALNQANQTGNYSVLRDLGAPGFQAANTPTRLAEAFSQLRNRNFDLAPVLFFDPKLVRPPAVQPNGLLRLSGFFPTAPQRVEFDLAFQLVEGNWRLFAIAVDTNASPDAAAVAPAAVPADEKAVSEPKPEEKTKAAGKNDGGRSSKK
jgi:hypothetical protein